MLDGALVPAFAPGCRAHVISGERVLVLSGVDRQLLLRGRPYALVAPLIDGRAPDTAIVAALADSLPAPLVQLALMRMQSRGVVVLGEPRAWRSLPSSSGDPGAFALPRPGEVRCLSVGVAESIRTWLDGPAQPIRAWLDARARQHPHAQSEDAADARDRALTVVVVDDYLRGELDELAARCVAADTALLPIRAWGGEWWFGPYLDGAAGASMWRLFRARLRANRAGDVEALGLGATFPLRGEPHLPDDAVIERVVAHAAELIEQTLRGEPPASIRNGVLVVDHDGGAIEQHRIAIVAESETDLLPAPGASAPAFGESLPPLRLAPDRRARVADSGRRVTAPADTLAQMAPLISPITGIVGGLERVPAAAGTFVYATAGTLDWGDAGDIGARPAPVTGADEGAASFRPLFRKGALGKGLTDAQARASCMGEAIELVSARFSGAEPRRRARWSDVAEHAIHPRELLLVSDAQYAAAAPQPPAGAASLAAVATPTTDAAAPPAVAWDGVPAPLDERHAIEWVPLVSLVDGATRWLPAACCYLDYDDTLYPGAPFAIANANGCAAGSTLAEAILQGLLELIERDACALWWYSRAQRPAIDLDTVGDPRLLAIRDAHAAAGRTLTLLDLTADTGVAVVAAIATDAATGTVLATGRGCHLDPAIAISRAITELSQGLAIASPGDAAQLGAAPAPSDPKPKVYHRSAAVNLRDSTSAARADAHLRPAPAPPLRLADLPDLRRDDAADEVAWCVRMLSRLGHDVLVLDTTRSELGFPAVRVVVPGLRPLLARLAPGRLYDVPPQLGWVPRALREDELNPQAFVS